MISTLAGMAIGVVLFALGYHMLTGMWPWENV
jgi:hypothetical protein